jgi:hypothetical protein
MPIDGAGPVVPDTVLGRRRRTQLSRVSNRARVFNQSCDSAHATFIENDNARHAHNRGPGDRGAYSISFPRRARDAKALQTSCREVPSGWLSRRYVKFARSLA